MITQALQYLLVTRWVAGIKKARFSNWDYLEDSSVWRIMKDWRWGYGGAK